LVDPDEAIVCGIRQPRDQYGIDRAEDRRARANAEREHERRSQREARAAPERTRRVSNIVRDLLDQPHAAGIPVLLGEPVHSAERDRRSSPCLVDWNTVDARKLVRFHLDVQPHLVIDIAIERVAVDERAKPPREPVSPVRHGALGLIPQASTT